MALIGLGVPRTIAAWSTQEADPAVEALSVGKRPSVEELARAAKGLDRAASFVPWSETLVKLGEIELAQAGAADIDRATQSDLLVKAEMHLTEAVRANPGQVFGWLILAEVRSVRGASGRDIVVPLVQTLDIAPHLRLAWIPRAGLLLRYWQFLNIEELPVFSDQIRIIWAASPAYRTQLIEAAIRADEMEVVAAAIGEPHPTSDELRQMQVRKSLRVRSVRVRP